MGKAIGVRKGKKQQQQNHEKELQKLRDKIPSDELLDSLRVHNTLVLPRLSEELEKLHLNR